VNSSSPREAQVFYLVGVGAFIAWLTFSSMYIYAGAGAVRVLLDKDDDPTLIVSGWSTFTLSYGPVFWLLPVVALAAVVCSIFGKWGFRARILLLSATAVAALATHVALVHGVYAPVVWFMNRVL